MVTFDRYIKARDGWVGEVDIVSILCKKAKEKRALMYRGSRHARRKRVPLPAHLGHPNEKITRAAAKAIGIKLSSKFQKYEDCTIAKARQKNVKKIRSKKAKHSGGRICLDISSPEYKGVSGKRHWLLFLNEHSDMCLSRLPKQKSDLPATALRKRNKNKTHR